MTLSFRSAAWALVVVSLLGAVGCGKRSVGRVGESKLTQETFYRRLQRFPSDPQAQFPTPINQQAATSVLSQMITETLILDLAKKEGVEPSRQQLDDRKKQMNGALTDRLQPDLNQLLSNSGMSHKELDERLAPEIARYNIIGKYVKVTPQEVRAAYDGATKLPSDQRVRSLFYLPEAVRVYGILAPSKAQIDKAKKQLDNQMAFGVVAEQYSADEMTKRRKGDIGWITRPDSVRRAIPGVPSEIYQKAFSTTAGRITEPFKAGNDWVILRIEEKRPSRMQDYDHVKGIIRDRLLQTKLDPRAPQTTETKKVNTMFRNLTKEKVEVNLPGYKDAIDQLLENVRKQAAEPQGGPTTQGVGGTPAPTGQ